MINRRRFVHTSLIAGISYVTAGRTADAAERPAEYRLALDTPTRKFDGQHCWCHPRAGIVPGAGRAGHPRVVMTMNTLNLSGSDVFEAMYDLHTNDLGATWTEPRQRDTLAPRMETIDGQQRPVAASDFWPTWHRGSHTLLGTGHSVVYTPEWKITHSRPRHTTYAVYEPNGDTWSRWRNLEMPDPVKFHNAGAGCTQRYDLPDGAILLPFCFTPPESNSQVAVARCSFDGQTLRYEQHGNELRIADATRGFHEPSLTRLGDWYLLTLRNDKQGFVTRSRDGLEFEPYRPWAFDDGQPLGNYNTQQHWVTHSEAVFLVYTRRGANNDHVFRHRAPLFMAQVDPERLVVLRDTEQIIVPERGARLGNFGVVDVSANETWVTVAEWMQPKGVEKYGSDGTVFVARLHWKRPNRLFS